MSKLYHFYSCTRGLLLLTLAMGGLARNSRAQEAPADTLQLEGITVVATRIHQSLNHQPVNIQVIDSSRISMLWGDDVGQLLAAESSLFIKNHGPGTLSNASQHGLSSEQIQILWEGIPINNIMLGQKDLSLLPASFFSSIQVSSGTPSTAFGGGSLSGAVNLSSDWDGRSHLSIRENASTVGRWKSSLNGTYHQDGWKVAVRSLINRADNDYTYYNRAYDRDKKRRHNRQEQENVMATVGHKSSKQQWESKFWFSNSNNQLPGQIITNSKTARQKDQSVRWLSRYQRQIGKASWEIKNYFDRVKLQYFDPPAGTRSLSTTRRWLLNSNVRLPVNKHIVGKAEISGGLSGVETNNYASSKVRRQVSATLNPELVFAKRKFHLYPALRLDSYSDFGTVVSPSLGMNYELLPDKLFLRGQLSRDFNPPTFNALYWKPTGNPDLQPERSNSAEAGITLKPRISGFSSFKLSGFYTNIDNGIRWFANKRDVFSPTNVEQINTKGIEAELNNRYGFGSDWQIELKQSASFTHAQITELRFQGDQAPGHQMRYVPRWKYRASLSLRKGIAAGLIHYRWVSRRYFTATENVDSSLDPYGVIDATLQLQKKYLGIHFILRGGLKNITNTNYEIVQWYAQPHRNVNLTLTATYNF